MNEPPRTVPTSPTTDPFGAPDLSDYPPPEPPKKSWFTFLFVLLLLVTVAVLSYYIQVFRKQLVQAKTVSVTLSQQLTDCENKLKTCTDNFYTEQVKYEAAEARISDMVALVESSTSELATLQTQQMKTAKELAEFKEFTAKFRDMIDTGKLNTSIRRGRMVVNLPAKVLFPSGSPELSEDGQKAISQVAKILRQMKNRRFIIAGHTDNIRIGKADFSSNWDLSAARAVHVTEAMIKSGMNPSRLAASGFSEFDPIAGNRTEEQRQKNRRIEIILEPYLPDLPKPEPPEDQKYRRSAPLADDSKAGEAEAEDQKYRRSSLR